MDYEITTSMEREASSYLPRLTKHDFKTLAQTNHSRRCFQSLVYYSNALGGHQHLVRGVFGSKS